ncbi:MAG: DnaJ domain-containing protein [Bdellovibrionota bacterium]
MDDYYKILGLNLSATEDEIRRAYRILARRYHPDVNPGKNSEDRFKKISEAYKVLSDATKKKDYDSDFQTATHTSFRAKQNQKFRAQSRYFKAQKDFKEKAQNHARSYFKKGISESASRISKGASDFLKDLVKPKKNKTAKLKPSKQKTTNKSVKTEPLKVSIIEASVSIHDAIFGIKKTIEIAEPEGIRKVSVSIPSGSRPGKVIRMRSTTGNSEELVIILRVAPHSILCLEPKGLVIKIPITVKEAVFGAAIKVPGIEEQNMITIPQGSQSGTELRLKNKGISLADGNKEDLFYRIEVQVPNATSAVGLKEKIDELEQYYEQTPRKKMPTSITSM